MRFVVDASVALKWFVQEAGSDLAERIAAEHELIAPELIVAEVHNGLWRIERLGRLSAEDVAEATASFPRYFDRLFALTPGRSPTLRRRRASQTPNVCRLLRLTCLALPGSARHCPLGQSSLNL